jgi:hypothetical protein
MISDANSGPASKTTQLNKAATTMRASVAGTPRTPPPPAKIAAPVVRAAAPAPAPAPARPAPAPSPAPVPGFGPLDAPAAPAPKPPSETEFLNSDDVYLAALSRYNKQFGDLEADITRRGTDYESSFGKGVADLGYIDNTPDIAGDETWAFDDQNTAAGRAFQSLIQDFAARGLLHSGDYLRSSEDLKSNLGRQYTGMADARGQFQEGLNSERTGGQTGRDAGIGQAKAEALARMAAQYGTV